MPEATGSPAPLDEVMLAMDVVDTLRHREQIVERELNRDDHDQALIARLKGIYAEQGIDVPESVLAEGVAALREDRFAFKPPAPGLSLKLARVYVRRGLWLKRLSLGALVAAVLGAGYHYGVTVPETRHIDQRISRLNTELDGAAVDLSSEADRLEQLRQALARSAAGVPAELAGAIEPRVRQAQGAFEQASRLISTAAELPAATRLTRENYRLLDETVADTLRRRQAVLGELSSTLQAAHQSVREIDELTTVWRQLPVAREAIAGLAREATARSQAQRLFDSGLTALRRGDLSEGRARLGELDSMRDRLDRSYRLLVVSRPGEQSGVWRIPDANPSARNYYLIVEAVTATGERLTVPVANEENGRIERVKKWGLRVSRKDYDRIAADKQDDGIIQDNVVGEKRQGFLEPEYSLQTSGAAITRW